MTGMRFTKYIFFLTVFVYLLNISHSLFSQNNLRDSSITIPMFSFHYAFQMPGNNLADRFGENSNIGAGFALKTSGNWIAGLDFNFIFGNNIKEDSTLRHISTPDGNIIGGNGIFADVSQFERGFYFTAKLGKVIPSIGPNPNSGILFTVSPVFFQHKIRTEVVENIVPELLGDYLKGYDRLTNGFGISQFLGYMYMGNNRLTSFYIGIEMVQAWTKNRRSWDFDLMTADSKKRYDTLIGVKFGWIVPLYRKSNKAGYFYF